MNTQPSFNSNSKDENILWMPYQNARFCLAWGNNLDRKKARLLTEIDTYGGMDGS
jgi:hypothetical protein